MSVTPKQSKFRRSNKFVSPAVSSAYKSPLLDKKISEIASDQENGGLTCNPDQKISKGRSQLQHTRSKLFSHADDASSELRSKLFSHDDDAGGEGSQGAKKVKLDYESMTTEELRETTLELSQKCKDIQREISELENQGYDKRLKSYIDKLHEYNEVKDVAQMLMGKIAVTEGTTFKEIHKQFGLTEID